MQPRVCNTRPVECGQSLVARPCSGLASALHANATPPTTPQYKQYPVYSTSPPLYNLYRPGNPHLHHRLDPSQFRLQYAVCNPRHTST